MVRAVIFDFIGTLSIVEGYEYDESVQRMYRSLRESGVCVDFDSFSEVFEEVHQKYAIVRYEKLVEVNTVVWLCETLTRLGFQCEVKDEVVKRAVDSFYENYLDSLKARVDAKQTVKTLAAKYTLGLVSNFTHAPVIYAGLRKIGLNQFFNAILVSAEVGWRKPHSKIFEEALKRLVVKAEEAIFVGDNPIDDIQGAKNIGMKAIFIPSQFSSLEDIQKAPCQPDSIIRELRELLEVL
jgi:putative hydrolase of the HAD superfamily